MSDFGLLRSLLQRPPSQHLWEELCKVIDETPQVQAEQQFLPYIQSYLKRWPKDISRDVPDPWAQEMCKGNAPTKMALCDTLILDGDKPKDAIEHLVACAHLSGLEHLNICDWDVSDDDIALLSQQFEAPSLHTLSLNRCTLSDHQLAILCQNTTWMTQVTTLLLWGNKLTSRGLEMLSSSPAVSSIEKLSMWDNQVDSAGLIALAKSPFFSNLRHLDFDDNNITDEGIIALMDSNHINVLHSLELYENNLSVGAMHAMVHSSICKELQFLNVRYNNQLGAAAMHTLADSEMLASLKTFNVAGCNIGDEGFAALVGSEAFSGTERLIAWSNHLTDTAAKFAAKSPFVGDLLYMDLDINDLTEVGRNALSTSPNLKDEVRVTFQ